MTADNVVEIIITKRNETTGRYAGKKRIRFAANGPNFPKDLVPIDPHGQPVRLLENPPGPVTHADSVARGLDETQERLIEVGRQFVGKPNKRRGHKAS